MTKVALHDETCSIFFEEKSHKKCDNKSAKKSDKKSDKKPVINTSDKINRTKIG